jgi:hypothetical protein
MPARPHLRPRQHRPAARILGGTLLLAIAAALVAGVIGGLLRAGVAVPLPDGSGWPGQAVLAHAFLIMVAFMGTVIGLERAVAVGVRWAFAAPAAAALAGVLMLAGWPALARGLALLAAFGFIAVNVAVVARQPAPHTALLLTGAAAWLVGNVLHALGAHAAAVVPWWFAFLVLTIAAERLEMTRLMRRRRGSAAALNGCLGLLLAGAAAFALAPTWGGLLYGTALTGLAIWLVAFDIARRTVASHGLSRYMAVCLLLGYAWLGVAGAAWIATALGHPARDAALHALGIGFVVSMMFGHAPVILPALARIKLQFGAAFYLPLALLHASLALRLFGAPHEAGLRSLGAAGNAAAIGAFALTVFGAALAWRRAHPASSSSNSDAIPAPH